MTWERRSGIVDSDSGQARRAVEVLRAARVLAVVESDPDAPDTVLVTLAVDPDGHVAVLGDDGTSVATGGLLAEVVQELADGAVARVGFDAVHAVGVGAEREPDTDPFEQGIDVESAYFPDRGVVFTRGGEAAVTALATVVDDDVAALAHDGGELVLVADSPGLMALSWPAGALPALVLEQGAAFPSVTVVGGADPILFTWDTVREDVPPGLLTGPAHEFVDGVLGAGALVSDLTDLFPAADPAAVRAAVDGSGAGLPALVAALGLPEGALAFLDRAEDPLAEARLVHPDTIADTMRRAVADASEQIGDQFAETAEAVRLRAEEVRARAEAAVDAAENFTEEVVLPVHHRTATPALALAETALAVLALRRARKGGAWGAVLAVGGSLLLVDAVVNVALTVTAAVRERRENTAT